MSRALQINSSPQVPLMDSGYHLRMQSQNILQVCYFWKQIRYSTYRLGDIEEAISEMEELIDIEDDIAEIDDEFQIVVSGWSVYVESLNLTLRQGISCVWDAEEGLFMPDFDVTIVYEGNIETQEWLYYEQDGMIVTLGNWLNGRLSCEQIEQLWCELIIPEKNKEQKESEE